MRNNIKKSILLCIFLVNSGCTDSSWLDIHIPVEASNQYQDYPFSKYSRQTSFEHKVSYPDVSVITSIENQLGEEWVSCSYGGGDWQNFADSSGKEPKYIFQRLKLWKTKNNDRQLFLSLRYNIYKVYKPRNAPSKPIDNLQAVTIIESVKPWWNIWEYSDDLCDE